MHTCKNEPYRSRKSDSVSVDLSVNHVTKMPPSLEALSTVRKLDLSVNHIPAVRGLDELSNLRWLSLNNNDLTKIEGVSFCHQLRHLDLSLNRITRIEGLEGLADFPAQQRKAAWMTRFEPWADALRRKRKPVLIAGDFNIARCEHDIYHWRSNGKTSGFLPHERDWMNRLVASGWYDTVRESAGDVDGPYTWWSNRGQARILDRGWRIDYVLLNGAARKRFRSVHVDREAALEVSDHGPVVVDLE